ncbi:MAG: dihydroorotase [Lentisphaerae bacterium GWF2_45_14]|nr:MAG: dihydroorotase [Lentisphaerae bacterium GWF2_45_14]
MTEKNSWIIKGGRLIDPVRGIDEIRDIGIMDGFVADVAEVPSSAQTIMAEGLIVAPGLIDMHVHLRQPGKTAAETIATGTFAAAAGGFTSILPMPNTSPVADTPASIEYIRAHALREGVVKVLPVGAMTKGSEGKEMAGIGGLKKAGVVALSDDGKCVQNHEIMRHLVEYSKSFNLPILDHCEDEILMSGGVMHDGYWSVILGMRGITSAVEEMMVARDVILARMAGWKIHIQHISARESIELVRNARRRGIMISAEATPHHIALTDECVKNFDTNYKMNPPLRSEDDRQAIIAALKDGTISVIASDHAPHTETEKLVEFDYAPFGIVGLETAVSICLTELYHKGYLTLSELISKWTKGPAEVLGLDIGTLNEGMPADITIIDTETEFVIDKERFLSKSRNTPFHGCKVKGRPVATIVNGIFVHNLMS